MILGIPTKRLIETPAYRQLMAHFKSKRKVVAIMWGFLLLEDGNPTGVLTNLRTGNHEGITLISIVDFSRTKEGHDHWWDIHVKVRHIK